MLPEYDGTSGIRVMLALVQQLPERCTADVIGKWLEILWARQGNKSPAPELAEAA